MVRDHAGPDLGRHPARGLVLEPLPGLPLAAMASSETLKAIYALAAAARSAIAGNVIAPEDGAEHPHVMANYLEGELAAVTLLVDRLINEPRRRAESEEG